MSNALGFSVDSGDFVRTFDRAMMAADVAGFAERRADSEARGLLRGLGFVYHIKGTGGSPHENVDIRFEDDGTVSLITGTQTIGQGHETTFPQILADRLGIPNETIRLRQGDTDLIPMGGGHGSSRATYMGGTAIWRASETIVEKGRAIAAEMLEAAEDDIAFADGHFAVVGTNRSISLLDVATQARGRHPLDTYHAWTREHMTFPNGTHVVEVEIDRETGVVTLARLTAVDDYGVLVNPMIVAGQAHGAIAQGVGQALLEHAVYDAESGQLLAGIIHGLRNAAGGRSALVPSGFQRYAVHHQSAGREGVRRGGRSRDAAGNHQRRRGCAGTVRGDAVRWTGDTVRVWEAMREARLVVRPPPPPPPARGWGRENSCIAATR